MRAITRLSLKQVCLVAAILVHVPGASARGHDHLLGLDSLSDEDKRDLWEKVDRVARFEAAARACGNVTNVERRVTAAVQGCVTPEAIKRVVARFNHDVKANKFSHGDSVCKEEKNRKVMADYKIYLEQIISEASLACSTCVTLGVCK